MNIRPSLLWNSSRRLTRAAAAALALGALWLAFPGCTLAPSSPTLTLQQRAELNLKIFDRVWGLVHHYYYDPQFNGVDWMSSFRRFRGAAGKAANDDELYDLLNHMLGELKDSHTGASTPQEVREFKKREGVLLGLVMSRVPGADSETVVTEVVPKSPAAEAGVRPGWILTSANGKPAREVVGAGRLADGEQVVCGFLDESDQPRLLTLKARRLGYGSNRESRLLPGGYLCLRFDEFDPASARWFRRQIADYRGVPGLIVDLRANLGGQMGSLEETLGEFFPRQVDIGTFVERGGRKETDRSMRRWGSSGYSGPVVVLISRESASCAEIFAQVLRHYDRAVLIGAKTGGNVLGSELEPLPGGGELQISVLDYHAPGGRRLEGVGVAPDEEVVATLGDLRTGADPAIERAVEKIKSK